MVVQIKIQVVFSMIYIPCLDPSVAGDGAGNMLISLCNTMTLAHHTYWCLHFGIQGDHDRFLIKLYTQNNICSIHKNKHKHNNRDIIKKQTLENNSNNITQKQFTLKRSSVNGTIYYKVCQSHTDMFSWWVITCVRERQRLQRSIIMAPGGRIPTPT